MFETGFTSVRARPHLTTRHLRWDTSPAACVVLMIPASLCYQSFAFVRTRRARIAHRLNRSRGRPCVGNAQPAKDDGCRCRATYAQKCTRTRANAHTRSIGSLTKRARVPGSPPAHPSPSGTCLHAHTHTYTRTRAHAPPRVRIRNTCTTCSAVKCTRLCAFLCR